MNTQTPAPKVAPFKTIIIERLQNRLYFLSVSRTKRDLADNRAMATVLLRIAVKRGHVQARAIKKYEALIACPVAGVCLHLYATGQFPRNFWDRLERADTTGRVKALLNADKSARAKSA